MPGDGPQWQTTQIGHNDWPQWWSQWSNTVLIHSDREKGQRQLQATVTYYSNGSISQEPYQLHSCNYEKNLEEVFHRAFSERDLDLEHLTSRIIQNLDLKPPVLWYFITTNKVTKQWACEAKLSQLCLLCLESSPFASQTRKAVGLREVRNLGCFLTSHWPLRSLSTVWEQSPGRTHLPWGYSSLCACWKTCMQCDQCHKACQWQYTKLMVPRVHHDVHCLWWPFEVDPNNIAEMQSQNWRLKECMSQRPFENEVEVDSDLTGLFGSLLSRQVFVHNKLLLPPNHPYKDCVLSFACNLYVIYIKNVTSLF